jgi:hypothetical protein
MPQPVSQPLVWRQVGWQQLVWQQVGWLQLEPQVPAVEQMGNPQKLVEQQAMVSEVRLRGGLLREVLSFDGHSHSGPFISLGQLLFA